MISNKKKVSTIRQGYVLSLHPLQKAFKFEIDGKPATQKNGKPNVDANGYKLVFFVGKHYLKTFKQNLPKFYKWYYYNKTGLE